MIEPCPCRYCENRHVGCHSECNKYQEWAKLNTLEREKRQAAERIAYMSYPQKPKRRRR